MDPSNEQQQQQQQQQHHHHLLHQEMGGRDETLESMLECRKTTQQLQQEKKAAAISRPAAEESLKCPRCDSTNTKFCYYNNYSLTQPRYFCKSCRRYWTKGGTLRNVPVGGGCRKNNKRSSSNSSASNNSSFSSAKRAQDHQSLMSSPIINPMLSSLMDHHHQSDQISLAIARLQNQNQISNNHHFVGAGQIGGFENGYSIFGNNNGYFENPSSSSINGFHNPHQLFGNGTGNDLQNGGFLRNLGLINGSSSEEILGINSSSSSMAAVAAYGGGGDQEMGSTSSVKQEGENQRVLMAGFPWQFGGVGGGGDQTGNMVDFEPPVKPNWNNGFGSSSWHGLLNSPLM